MIHWLTPELHIDSVVELDIDRLRELGFDALLLDVDCTLKNYRSEEVSPAVAAWLREVEQSGIAICLVSNGGGQRIKMFAERLGLPFVAQAMKPFPFGALSAATRLGFPKDRTAMVGDQLFADIMAGRIAGLRTVLVRPIHPEEEPWFTRIKRPFERMVLSLTSPKRRRPREQTGENVPSA